MNEEIKRRAETLKSRDSRAACAAAEELVRLSESSRECVEYFDLFASLLREKSSLARNRGLRLLAANAKWDDAQRLDGIIDEFLSHIEDEKPITARMCVKALPEIARSKPRLRERILKAIASADTSKYPDSMRPLVDADLRAAAEEIRNMEG